MRCHDFQMSAESRPGDSVTLSPRLAQHLETCPPCRRWQADRERWGDLGALFRQDDEPGSADLMALRGRVRASVASAESRRGFWVRPAYAGLAAGLLAVTALAGLVIRDGGLPDVGTPASEGVEEEIAAVTSGQERPANTGAQTAQADPTAHSAREPEAATRMAGALDSAGPGGGTESGAASLRTAQAAQVGEPVASVAKPGQSRTGRVRVVRVGDDLAVEWPQNGDQVHRVVRSSNPADFSGGAEMFVRGNRWVDTSPEARAAGVQYYLID